MISSQAKDIKRSLFENKNLDYFLNTDISQQRKDWEESITNIELPVGITTEEISTAGIKGQFIHVENTGNKYIILYFHGGGLTMGSSKTHKKLGVNIAKYTQLPVFIHDYPLAPEYPYPSALIHSEQVYSWLIQKGYNPEHIIFGGDSSGCALALSLMMKLKDQHHDLPKAVFLLSPMLDFTLSGNTIQSLEKVDPCLFIEDMQMTVKYYCNGENYEHPYITPLNGLYDNFPPLLIQVGSSEMLLDDSIRLKDKARAAGVEVNLEIWKDMWHVFQGRGDGLPEAKQALTNIQQFIKKILQS